MAEKCAIHSLCGLSVCMERFVASFQRACLNATRWQMQIKVCAWTREKLKKETIPGRDPWRVIGSTPTKEEENLFVSLQNLIKFLWPTIYFENHSLDSFFIQPCHGVDWFLCWLSFARCTDRDNAARSIMRFVVHLVVLYRRFGSRVKIDCKGNKEVFRKKGGVEMR